MSADSLPRPPAPVARGERIAVMLILALFVALGLNNLRHLAFIGQDFGFHHHATSELALHPDHWFVQDNTSRPLIYWTAIVGAHVTNNQRPFEFAALVFILLNAAALGLLHDLARRFVTHAALRIATLAFVAFLPVTLITSVVFAADTLTTPFFTLLAWSLVRGSEAGSTRATWGWAALGGFGLALGDFSKFTFVVLPFAVLAIVFLLRRAARLSHQHVVAFLCCVVVVPMLVGGWLWRRSNRELAAAPQHHEFAWRGTGEMTWRSLLLVKPSDARILNAPTYWDRPNGDPRQTPYLLLDNDYSYPALLHLGIFTDVMDFALNGSTDNGAPRPEPEKSASPWAVRLGLVFSLLGLVAIARFGVRLVRSFLRPELAPGNASLIVGVLSLAWYVPITLTLPFIRHAYDWGYWLPRLVIPALWGFALETFGWLDRALADRPRLRTSLIVITAVQVGLHLLVIWH